MVTAVESGTLKVWGDNPSTIETGGPLSCMRQSPNEENIAGTGGKENELKLWDLETGKTTFIAKNVSLISITSKHWIKPIYISLKIIAESQMFICQRCFNDALTLEDFSAKTFAIQFTVITALTTCLFRLSNKFIKLVSNCKC